MNEGALELKTSGAHWQADCQNSQWRGGHKGCDTHGKDTWRLRAAPYEGPGFCVPQFDHSAKGGSFCPTQKGLPVRNCLTGLALSEACPFPAGNPCILSLVQVGPTTQTAAKTAAARMGEAAPRMATVEPLALPLMDRYLGQ